MHHNKFHAKLGRADRHDHVRCADIFQLESGAVLRETGLPSTKAYFPIAGALALVGGHPARLLRRMGTVRSGSESEGYNKFFRSYMRKQWNSLLVWRDARPPKSAVLKAPAEMVSGFHRMEAWRPV